LRQPLRASGIEDGIMMEPKVAAIILAAGASHRFGRPKQLLPWGEKTVLQHVVDTVLASPVERTIVVLGYRAKEIGATLADRPVGVVVNKEWEEGLSTSVRAGLSALGTDVDAALFVLADQPFVTPQIIAQLVERYRETGAPIVVPTCRGRRGNPVLFDRSLFAELMEVKGDQGGRQLIAKHEGEVERVEVASEAIWRDLDVREDYQKAALAAVRSLIVDMDGVLYRGREPIPGAREFVAFLQREGIPFLLLTNNSTLTPAQYVAKLARLGIEVGEDRILTSAQAAALYLERVAPPGAKVYLIGEEGLRAALREKGFAFAERGADFVVVGMDRQLTYEKLKIATLLIRGGARFIGTNPDKTFPSEEGIVPGNGATLAALEAATGVAPMVVGKPERAIFDLALARMGVGREGAAVVGDRLETDVLGGRRAGLITILVLSGVTTPKELAASGVQPDLVFEDVGQMVEVWRSICP